MLGTIRCRVVRKFSLVLLAAVMVSAVEPVVGLARDGAVHHETAAEAATHNGLANADHAHETDDAAETDVEQTEAPLPSDSDERHEHGSNADHCTHMHGIACPALPVFEHFSTVTWLEDPGTRPVRSHLPTSSTPPPNA